MQARSCDNSGRRNSQISRAPRALVRPFSSATVSQCERSPGSSLRVAKLPPFSGGLKLRGARHQRDRAGQAPAEGLLDVVELDRDRKVLNGRADPISDGLQQVGVETPQVDGV